MQRRRGSSVRQLGTRSSRGGPSERATHLAPGALAEVLALDAVAELGADGVELGLVVGVDDAPGELLDVGDAARARLEDVDEVGVRHEVVGLVAVDVDADALALEGEGDLDESGRLVGALGREEGEAVACVAREGPSELAARRRLGLGEMDAP